MKNPLDTIKRWLLDLLVPYIEGTNKKKKDKNETLNTSNATWISRNLINKFNSLTYKNFTYFLWILNKYAIKLSLTLKVVMNKSTNSPQRKTTLKWNINGELSSIDMARIIKALSVKELRECELACNRDAKKLNLGMWW